MGWMRGERTQLIARTKRQHFVTRGECWKRTSDVLSLKIFLHDPTRPNMVLKAKNDGFMAVARVVQIEIVAERARFGHVERKIIGIYENSNLCDVDQRICVLCLRAHHTYYYCNAAL